MLRLLMIIIGLFIDPDDDDRYCDIIIIIIIINIILPHTHTPSKHIQHKNTITWAVMISFHGYKY